MTVYSHSRLETFESCPLKYKFRYIDKIEKPTQGVEAFVGNRVHEALKKLYDDLLGGKRNTVEELLGFYSERWKAEWGSNVTIVAAGRTPKFYFDYGAQCVRAYYQKYQPFDQSVTLGTEERIDFVLDDGGAYAMMGYVDRVAKREDGTFEIHDYKTSRWVPTQAEANASRQLGLYQIGVRTRWNPAGRVELVWHYLAHGVTLRSARSPEQLVRLCEATSKLIERIEATKNFEPHKSKLCDWCEYKPDCPVWKK